MNKRYFRTKKTFLKRKIVYFTRLAGCYVNGEKNIIVNDNETF